MAITHTIQRKRHRQTNANTKCFKDNACHISGGSMISNMAWAIIWWWKRQRSGQRVSKTQLRLYFMDMKCDISSSNFFTKFFHTSVYDIVEVEECCRKVSNKISERGFAHNGVSSCLGQWAPAENPSHPSKDEIQILNNQILWKLKTIFTCVNLSQAPIMCGSAAGSQPRPLRAIIKAPGSLPRPLNWEPTKARGSIPTCLEANHTTHSGDNQGIWEAY